MLGGWHYLGMIRTRVSLTRDQMRRLALEAARQHISRAAVIRDAVDQFIADIESRRVERVETLLAASGSAASGSGSVAIDHDVELAPDRW